MTRKYLKVLMQEDDIEKKVHDNRKESRKVRENDIIAKKGRKFQRRLTNEHSFDDTIPFLCTIFHW